MNGEKLTDLVKRRIGESVNRKDWIPMYSHSPANGFTYITVMMFVVVIGIALSMTGKQWSTAAKREKEAELLFRGDQIRKAIEAYMKPQAQVSGHGQIYPVSLEELVKSSTSAKPKRYLRKIYSDPMTGKPDWVIVQDPATKRIMGVHSSSEEEPLKTSNFPFVYRGFEGKVKYSDWIFAFDPKNPNVSPVAVGAAGGGVAPPGAAGTAGTGVGISGTVGGTGSGTVGGTPPFGTTGQSGQSQSQ